MAESTKTMPLTDFLLARIAEDEAAAPFIFAEQFTPARILAECEAKRRIVEECARVEALPKSLPEDMQIVGAASALVGAMRCLALPYADHSDYDESWRP